MIRVKPVALWILPLAGLLPAIAGAAAAVLYDSPLLMLGVLLAAAAAGAAPVALLRSRPGTAGPAAVLALIVLVAVLLLRLGDGVTGLAAARELTGALPRLLSFAPPIPTRADTLTPPVVAVWAAAFGAAALAARGRRLAAAGPAVLVLIAALLLVGRAAPVPGWVAPVVALGAAVLMLEDSGRARGAARVSGRGVAAAGAGALVAVLVIALGVLGSRVVPDSGRVDAGARYQPPQERPQPVDPLTRLAGWAKGDPQILARVQVAAPAADAPPDARRPAITTWRWAILDDFDGSRWTSSARYRPTGERLRPVGGGPSSSVSESSSGTAAGPVNAGVQVEPVLAPWLPTPGAVRRVTGVSVAVNQAHDSLVQVPASERAASYGLVADADSLDALDSVDRAEIAGFRAGGAGAGAGAVEAPGLPAELDRIAAGFAPGPGRSDGERALGLQDLLREGEFVSDAPPGHLYARLKQFFKDDDRRAYLRGTSEQFATAFAVLARSVGLPTRIVVGFEVPAGVQADVAITGAQMRAWPEVSFDGQGWVRFAPTPPDRGGTSPRNPPKLKDLIPPTPVPAVAAPAASGSPTPKVPDPDPKGAGFPLLVAAATVLAGLVVLALAVLLVLVGIRLRRRAGRRRGHDPSARVIGAWRELEDAAVLANPDSSKAIGGSTFSGSATALVTRVRERADAEAVGEDLDELAGIANAAAFGPPDAVGPEQADRAWAISDRTTAGLRRTAPLKRRLRWWLG